MVNCGWTSPVVSVDRMLAVVIDGVFSSVLDSQVIVPLQHLGRQAPDMRRALLVLTSARHHNHPQLARRCAVLRAALPDTGTLFRFRAPLGLPFEDRRWARAIAVALDDLRYTGPAPIIVHCRGPGPAAAARVLRRCDPRLRILLDLRGDAADAVPGRGLLAWHWRRRARHVVAQAAAAADGLNVVSSALAEGLRRDRLLTRDLPTSVVGCCVDTQRFHFDPAVRAQRRRDLALDGKFVVCYCGSLAHWQRPDAIAAVFAAISRGMPDAHLLVICRDAAPLEAHLHAAGVGSERITVRGAAHEEVAAYLMAADLGLLLRENRRTNQVASPVKFAEYLRCGLPVILTPYIGDFAALVCRTQVGQAIQFPVQPDEALQAARLIRQQHGDSDAYRQHCSRVAGEQLSWEGHLPELLRVYNAMARSVPVP